MRSEILEIVQKGVDGQAKQPICIEFEGINTFSKDPESARLVYCGVKRTKNTNLLSKISNLIITTFLKERVIEESELSHVYKHRTG